LGTSSDEIARQIAETRDEIEGRIVVLRERGEVAVERGKRAALIAAGVGAGIAAVAIGAFVLYRMTRPPSTRERIERVIPATWWERVRGLRNGIELGIRKQVGGWRGSGSGSRRLPAPRSAAPSCTACCSASTERPEPG
jgi:hypothetical protein